MDSEARAHVVDGQKQPGGLFLGRGLLRCSHKEQSESALRKKCFLLWWEILKGGLCSRCSLKVFFDARGASFCFAKAENYAEARAHIVDGQKQPGGLFLGRGPLLCSHIEWSESALRKKCFFILETFVPTIWRFFVAENPSIRQMVSFFRDKTVI